MIIAHRPAQIYRRRKLRNRLLLHLILFPVSVIFILPVVLVLSASFSDEKDIASYGYTLFPRQFTLAAYDFILRDPAQLLNAYGVTLLVTFVGTTVGLLVMSLLAYALARHDFRLRRPLSFYVFFTMLFNGGVVPFYILVTQYLYLQDNLLALILPYLIVPWYLLLLRTYFAGLPRELLDAARIDGAGEWRIFFQIVLPLSKPALATVGLFCMLMYWNDWWLGLLFINDAHLVPLQYLLYKISSNIDFLSSNSHTVGIQVPTQSVRMAMAILAIGPIAFAFLFLQKYFIRGATLGGIKGD